MRWIHVVVTSAAFVVGATAAMKAQALPADLHAPMRRDRPDAAALARAALHACDAAELTRGTAARLPTYQAGLQWARRAVQIDPRSADAHFAVIVCRGRIMLSKKESPSLWQGRRVLRELDHVLALDPDHAPAHILEAIIYRRLPRFLGGSPEKASRHLLRALEIEPGSAVALQLLEQIGGGTEGGRRMLRQTERGTGPSDRRGAADRAVNHASS